MTRWLKSSCPGSSVYKESKENKEIMVKRKQPIYIIMLHPHFAYFSSTSTLLHSRPTLRRQITLGASLH